MKETDYAGWAAGLKQCGYATDPSYAAKLVNIIETYELYKYDTGQPVVAQRRELRGDETMEHTIDMAIVNEFKIMHKIRQKWGLYYVTVYPGDTYDSIAEEFGMKSASCLTSTTLTAIPRCSTPERCSTYRRKTSACRMECPRHTR